MKNRKKLVFGTIAVMIMLISSCGQAAFDVSLNPSDIKDIDLTALINTDLIIKLETYVETGNYGIDISKLVYDYTFNNKGTNTANIEVRLSLYGDANLNNNNLVTVALDQTPNDGYIDTEENWLTSTYLNTISNEGYGWISMIGSPATQITIPGNTIITNKQEILLSPVIDHILKQEGIWIVTYISAGIGNGTLDLINQSIQVEGSKATGYYPGAF